MQHGLASVMQVPRARSLPVAQALFPLPPGPCDTELALPQLQLPLFPARCFLVREPGLAAPGRGSEVTIGASQHHSCPASPESSCIPASVVVLRS